MLLYLQKLLFHILSRLIKSWFCLNSQVKLSLLRCHHPILLSPRKWLLKFDVTLLLRLVNDPGLFTLALVGNAVDFFSVLAHITLLFKFHITAGDGADIWVNFRVRKLMLHQLLLRREISMAVITPKLFNLIMNRPKMPFQTKVWCKNLTAI